MSVKPKSHAVKIVCCAIMHYHKCCSRIVNKDLSYIQYHTSSIPTYIYKALTYKDRSFIFYYIHLYYVLWLIMYSKQCNVRVV